jgi:hypothetical protein
MSTHAMATTPQHIQRTDHAHDRTQRAHSDNILYNNKLNEYHIQDSFRKPPVHESDDATLQLLTNLHTHDLCKAKTHPQRGGDHGLDHMACRGR